MVGKLTILCAKIVARNHTDQGQAQLRFIFEAALPMPVLSAALSCLPVNSLIRLEEVLPGNPLLEDRWQKLCDKCAVKHVPFRRKLKQFSKEDDKSQNYKELLLNAYFKEVLDTCSLTRSVGLPAKVPRMESQNILQDSLGKCKHNVSNEEMLSILANYITEMTFYSKYFACLKDLINSDRSCLGRLKYLKLGTCDQYYKDISTSDWISVIGHAQRNSHFQVLCTTTCCQILHEIVSKSSKDCEGDEKSSLWDEAVGSVTHSGDSKDNKESFKNFDIFDDIMDQNVVPQDSGLQELILSACFKHNLRRCKGLEFMYSLERLSIACKSDQDLTEYFVECVSKLLRSGLSNLKQIHMARAKFRKYEKDAHSISDMTDFPTDSAESSSDDEVEFHLPDIKFSDSGVESLAVSAVGEQYQKPYLILLFANLLSTVNPMYLWISRDENNLEFPLPYFSFPDPTVTKEGDSIRLQKITVIYQPLDMDGGYGQRPVVGILKDLITVLQNSAKLVDLCVYSDSSELFPLDICSKFKSFKMTLLTETRSVNSIEDFVAQM